jgi:hypothetical protein
MKRFEQFVQEVMQNERSKNFNFADVNGMYYVYRVTSKIDGKHYYGSRKSNQTNYIKDFWKYCTSSKRRDDIKQNKNNYRVKIIKTFTNSKMCSLYESYLHNYFDVKNNDKFFNECNAPIFYFDTRYHIVIKDGNKGKLIQCSEYDPEKHERFVDRTGYTTVKDDNGNTFSIKTSDERYNKTLYNVNKNQVTVRYKDGDDYFNISTEEFYKNRLLYITSTENKHKTVEQRKKCSEGAMNRKRIVCPYCGKEGDASNMKRWHFDNCKEKPGNENLIRKSPCKGRKFGPLKYKRKYKTVICPHCGKEGGIINMKRYHFDNCKEKND